MQTDLEKENKRLVECLRKANAQAEHFEREWYLRGDALEAAAQSLDAIARLAGKDQYLKKLVDVRLYAASRARVAHEALESQENSSGPVENFETWRKREYPHLGPIGDGLPIAREAWDAAMGAKAQARSRDFNRGYYCAVAALLAMEGNASTPVEELARMGGNMAHADAEDLERLRAAGLAR